jgi:hypothetical protein
MVLDYKEAWRFFIMTFKGSRTLLLDLRSCNVRCIELGKGWRYTITDTEKTIGKNSLWSSFSMNYGQFTSCFEYGFCREKNMKFDYMIDFFCF